MNDKQFKPYVQEYSESFEDDNGTAIQTTLRTKKTILVIGQGSRVLKMSISYLEMLVVMST